MLRTAAIPGRRSEVSAFLKLPVEIILRIMCHTAISDLRRLIETNKFMNEIFKTHKNCIFKRLQRYHFPEFLECFGERPEFDGPVPGDSRTSEQIQCLEDVVLCFVWDTPVSMPRGGHPGRFFLHLLERYGGWRYLYFLQVVKNKIEEEAQRLRRISLERNLDMTGEQVKAMTFCFNRMSWNGAARERGEAAQAAMSEEDRVAEVRMRVEDRLKFFRREPPALQELMTRTLTMLIFGIARALQLDIIATRYRRFYRPPNMASLTMAQRVSGWDSLISNIMAKTLLDCFFAYGIMNSMRMCEEPWEDASDVKDIRSDFSRYLVEHLQAVASGTVPPVDSQMLEGSLWAAGMGITFGWFVIAAQRSSDQ